MDRQAEQKPVRLLLLFAVLSVTFAGAATAPAICSQKEDIVSLFCRDGVCMPRLFILGAAKSSTTSLWTLMRWQLENICSPLALEGDPKWFRKEGTFFNVDEYFDDASHSMIKQSGLQRYRSRYVQRACPNKCSSFLDATPSYLHHPLVARRMYNLYLPEQRRHVRFIIMLREPASRDLSWFSVGEGIKSADWWKARKENCGSSVVAAATCYADSVKSAIQQWRQCMGEALSVYSLNCDASPASCLQLLASSEAVMAEVYEACGKNNRVALGIYIGQLVTWMRTWEPTAFNYNHNFLVMKNTDLTEVTIGAIQRHVSAMPLPANSTWHGKIPVENETRKKKEYLSVVPFCETEKTLRKFYEPYNEMLYTFCLDHQLGSCANPFVLPKQSNCLKK